MDDIEILKLEVLKLKAQISGLIEHLNDKYADGRWPSDLLKVGRRHYIAEQQLSNFRYRHGLPDPDTITYIDANKPDFVPEPEVN